MGNKPGGGHGYVENTGKQQSEYTNSDLETLLDLLELYTHHRSSTSVGPHFPADRFLTVRIPLNKEAEEQRLPRYTHSTEEGKSPTVSRKGPTTNGSANNEKDTSGYHPLIPATAHGERPKAGEKGRDAAVRFIVDSEYAAAEKARVAEYFKVEMEEYEVEE